MSTMPAGRRRADGVYAGRVKRGLDLVVGSVLLLASVPVMAVLGVLVRCRLGAPVLFRQPRPGLNGRIFTLLKLRTMTDERDDTGRLLPDEKRVTRFGAWLRSTSLDELPELVNVVRGDMSLVGPRPLLVEYLSRYTTEQARRHEARPGLTGWTQVNGRNALSWEDKFRLDVWYVDHVSWCLDLKILALTLWVVVNRTGVSAKEHATMPVFKGGGQG